MSGGAMTAETIGRSALFDPQLTIPVHPRRRRGLVVTMQAGQLIVEGGPKKQMFGGRFAQSLPGVLDRLDGLTDHSTLATDLAMTEQNLFKVVSLLWISGVIEEGPPAHAAPNRTPDRLADFLSRIGDATGANVSWELAAERLAAVRIEIFGHPGLAASVLAEIEDPMTASIVVAGRPAFGTTLVLLVQDGTGRPADSELAEHCWDNGIPLLRLRLAGRRAQLGPYVDRAMGPCLACLTAGENVDITPTSAADVALFGALAARELFAMLSRSIPSPLPMRWWRTDLENLVSVQVCAATRPGCRHCSVADGPMAAAAHLVASYERAVAMPPKAFADLKAHQMHYKPSNLSLQRKFKTWPTAPRTGLPAPNYEALEKDWNSSIERPRHLTVEDLGLLLLMTAGIQGQNQDRVLRWTASGGNIGSVTAYVGVRAGEHHCSGIAPGLYSYVAPAHELARISTVVGGLPGSAPITVVLTGDYPKVAQKYSAFALRIVLLDSGCAQATAREVAGVMGMSLRFRPRWGTTTPSPPHSRSTPMSSRSPPCSTLERCHDQSARSGVRTDHLLPRRSAEVERGRRPADQGRATADGAGRSRFVIRRNDFAATERPATQAFTPLLRTR